MSRDDSKARLWAACLDRFRRSGLSLTQFGRKEDFPIAAFYLVYEPAKLYRQVNEYPKYACKCCKEHGVVSTERPTGLVEGNKCDSSVAAAVVVQ